MESMHYSTQLTYLTHHSQQASLLYCLANGIPTNMLDNIFDSMVSARVSNSDNRLHFGIGLYVVRIIAEHHGGTVKAANLQNGNGVTIQVTLPLYKRQSHADMPL